MSTAVLVEQRPPFIVMLASRIPTYTHMIISLLAVLLFQAFPSWTIAKPPVREITRKRRSASLTSNTSTLVNPEEAVVVKQEINENEKEKSHRVSFSSKIPFNRLSSSVKKAISRSKSIKPKFPRRLTLPARRFSLHIVTALHNLTPHHHHRPQENPDSYFPSEKAKVEGVNMAGNIKIESDMPVNSASPIAIAVSVTQTTKVETVAADKEAVKQRESYITIESSQKTRTFKQFTRRASTIFKDIRLRRS